MKGNFLILAMLLSSNASFSQNVIDILKRSFEKCQSTQNGYYEMTKYMKVMSRTDTIKFAFNCHFKKLKDDTLYSSAFHYKSFFKDKYTGDVLYTGEDFVYLDPNDSTASIKSKSKWANEIKQVSHNYTFYFPLTNKISFGRYPLPHDSDFIDGKHQFKLIEEVNIHNSFCYHIQENITPENDTSDDMQDLRRERHYWIKKDDFIPIQYSKAIDVVMNNDTMYQYELFVLNKYELNNLKDENILSLNSIPSYFKLTDYVPYQSPELLPKDTIAPNWELLSLTDQKISLNNLKGKLILIDFFYKSCYPCMQALPALQSLNEKFKDKGLKVIGIDPYDKKEDNIAEFLSKRGVTYTVFLNGKDTAKDYHVSGYPTIYLIDKNGKIIFIQEGFGKDTENILEEIIIKNL